MNLSYGQGLQSGHWLLLGILLGSGGIYTLDMAWANVAAQRRTIALQKALGWRSRSIFIQVLAQVLVIATTSAISGAILAWVVAQRLGWQSPSIPILVGVPLLVVGLSTLGGLHPAWLASRIPPILVLQRSGGRAKQRFIPRRGGGLWSYAWRDLLRRPGQTTLSVLAAALASALLVLLAGVSFARQGLLTGTLLGEFLLIRVERFHYILITQVATLKKGGQIENPRDSL